MATAAVIDVLFKGDTSGLDKSLGSIEGNTKRIGAGIGAIGKVSAAAFGVAAAGAAGFAAAAVSSINAASDMGETQSKLNAVFGETGAAADMVAAALDGSAQKLLLSRAEAGEAIGTYGNLLTAMGHSGEASAEMSTSMVQLAADLASFNNMDPTETLEKLRAGLVGESEPLKTLGVNMNQARLDSEAFELGLIGAGEKISALDAEMQAQIKSQAAYSIIMKDTATAQGDVARTGDGFANSIKQIKASFADMRAELGQKLLPAIEPLVDAFSDAMPGAIESVSTALTPLLDGISEAITAFFAVDEPMSEVEATLLGLSDTVEGGHKPMSEFSKLIDKARDAFEAWWPKIKRVFDYLVEHKETVAKIAAAFVLLGPVAGIVSGITTVVGALAGVVGLLGLSLGPLVLAVGAVVAAFLLIKVVRDAWAEHGDAIKAKLGEIGDKIKTAFGDAWETAKGKFSDFIDGAKKLGQDIITGIVDGIKDFAGNVRDALTDAASNAWDAVTGFWESRSPSQRAARLGRWIMEGMALGITAGGVTAAASMHAAMSALAKAMSDPALENAQAALASLMGEIADARLSMLSGDERSLVSALIDAGELERAAELFDRFIQDQRDALNAAHDENMANLAESQRLRQADFDTALRRIQSLQDALGPDSGIISDFSGEKDRIESLFGDVLGSLGFGGSTALDDFWFKWTGEADKSIDSVKELMDAIKALAGEQQRMADDVADQANATHAERMAQIDAQLQALDRMLSDQAFLEQNINDIIAERERLLGIATAAIKAQQKAQEAFEDRVHEQVVAMIEEKRDAAKRAHDATMRELEAERQAILDRFDAAQVVIDHMKVSLAELEADLGLPREIARLAEMRDGLAKIRAEIAAVNIISLDPIGQNAAARKRQTDKARADTPFQRALIQGAISSGKLDERQMFIAERLLLGFKFNAEEVAAIFGIVSKDAADQVDAQARIVSAKQAEIDKAVELIANAELLLKIDRDRNVEALAGLDARIAAEKTRYDLEREALDDLMAREKTRHADRMAAIAAEWALELARLGMNEDEIRKMIDAAQRMARDIAEAARKAFSDIVGGIAEAVAAMDPIVLPPIVLPPGGILKPDPENPGGATLNIGPGGDGSAGGGGIIINIEPTVEAGEIHIAPTLQFNMNDRELKVVGEEGVAAYMRSLRLVAP